MDHIHSNTIEDVRIPGRHLSLEERVKSIFVCKIPLGTQNLMQMPYFAAG